jgi:chemotaxis protein MotB
MARKTVCLALAMTVLLMSGCVSKNRYLDLESDLVESRQQVDESNQDLKALQTKYSALETEKQGLETRLRQLEAENTQMASRSEDLSRQLQAERSELEEKERVIQELFATRKRIEEGLKDQIAAQQIKIEDMEGRLKVTFVDKILFNSGSAKINAKGKELLLNFAESFQGADDQNIAVEGHTDNVGVGENLKNIFPTNWELSTARATAVVRFLQEEGGLAPEGLSAAGYSAYHPLADNDTEEGRSQNRRIEIVLVPEP